MAVGVVGTAPADDIGARLLAIEAAVAAWIAEHQPDAVAVERVFSQHNVRTVMGTAQASAAAIIAAARAGVPVALHTPSEMKAAVTGSGRADKAQVTAMVTRILRLTAAPRPADAADALGLAICHVWRGRSAGPDRLGAGDRDRGGGCPVIAFVSGRVAALAPDGAVVEVGGVGLTVQCTPATIAALRVGEQAHLPTSLVVREDSLTLYGFADEDERVVFELLQTASGVGPRLAQAMLAVHGPDALRRAVATEDLAALTQVPGIGRKGAQRIVLELKDRLGRRPRRRGDRRPAARRPAGWRDQLHGALLGLGWSSREADEGVASAAPYAEEATAAGEPPDVGALLKVALRSLSRA